MAGRAYLIQSWDTGNKVGPNCAYSCCITALVIGKYVYILDVVRKRIEFPELRTTAIALAREYKVRDLLIEDMASGIELIQELRATSPAGVPAPIPVTPERDKDSRVMGISAMIEAGQLILPREAPWLPELKSELLGVPHTRYRDRVDALTQLMARVRLRQQWPVPTIAGPESVDYEDDDDGRVPGARFPPEVRAIRIRKGRRVGLYDNFDDGEDSEAFM